MKENTLTSKKLWGTLLAPSVLFLIVTIAVSVYYGIITRGDAAVIAEKTPQALPYILVITLGLSFLILLKTMRSNNITFHEIGWQLNEGQTWVKEALLGVLVGAPLGVLYIYVLSPLLTTVQRAVGDYVPPEEILSSLGSSVLPFFIANVILAPIIEENIFRGFALSQLRKRFNPPITFILSCLVFGLFHWGGGFWYIVLVGTVAGGTFAGLYMWRRNIVSAFAAHLALNIVEFLFVWLVL